MHQHSDSSGGGGDFQLPPHCYTQALQCHTQASQHIEGKAPILTTPCSLFKTDMPPKSQRSLTGQKKTLATPVPKGRPGITLLQKPPALPQPLSPEWKSTQKPPHREELQKHILDYFQTNEDSVSSQAVLWEAHKAVIRGYCIALGSRIKKDVAL